MKPDLPSRLSTSKPSPTSNILAIEGMPGGGKTTVLSAIAEKFEGRSILLSEMNFEPKSHWQDVSTEKKGEIFLRLLKERMALLKTVNDSTHCFMLDRTYFSNFAYTYALDALQGTNLCSIYQELLKEKRFTTPFEQIFVFDVSPEEGLHRRRLRNDTVFWPWNSLKFLEAIRKFYRHELPKYTNKKMYYIDAFQKKDLVIAQVAEEVLKCVPTRSQPRRAYITPNDRQKALLYNFAKFNQLGEACTRIINVLGTPTLYFLKHSLQLVQGQPVFFNNIQLRKILNL